VSILLFRVCIEAKILSYFSGTIPSTHNSPKLLSFKILLYVNRACSSISLRCATYKSLELLLFCLKLLKSKAEITVLPVPVAATIRFLNLLCTILSACSFSKISC
jgi:hypothetical protein